jgi:hypothetical protein
MESMPEALKVGITGITKDVVGGAAPVASPCDAHEFKYFQTHPTERTHYYQCDPWGTFVEHVCENKTIWDRWTLMCQPADNVRNLTSPLSAKIANIDLFNCSQPEYECINGGECVFELKEYKCSCPVKFTGDFCEIEIADADLYSEIMSGNFSLEDYVKRLMNENITLDISFYAKYKDVLDSRVYVKLVEYLSHYQKGLVRYDTLVNSLIEDILSDIYPDADFLRSFNVSAHNVVTTVRLVPNLLSYARYSSEHYKEVFAQYQSVLDQLWIFLNATSVNISAEAVRYSELTGLFLNETIRVAGSSNRSVVVRNKNTGRNFFVDPLTISATGALDTIRSEYEVTLNLTSRVFAMLNEYEKTINSEFEKRPEIVKRPIVETKISGTGDLIKLFEQIEATNLDIWDTLISYGFWFVTKALVHPTVVPMIV